MQSPRLALNTTPLSSSFWTLLLTTLTCITTLFGCIDGNFRRECSTNDDCASGQVCIFSNCVVDDEGNTSTDPDAGDTSDDVEPDSDTSCTPSEEICDGIDNDCDGLIDTQDPDFTFPLCDNQNGVCQGARQACQDGALVPCDSATYTAYAQTQGNTYEDGDETLCDNVDNNCNGLTDSDDPTLLTPLCDNQNGVCQGARRLCQDGTLTTCNDATYTTHAQSQNNTYEPNGETLCDGADNDCDGDTDAQDPDWVDPLCQEQEGVCQGARQACVDGQPQGCDPDGYNAHAQTQGNTYEPSETSCDGVDNDCDGLTDSDDPDYQAPLCTKQNGVCQGARQICSSGTLTPCDDTVYTAHAQTQGNTYEPSETSCDNQDNDCDELTDADDPDLEEPLCDNQNGVCIGARLRCVNGERAGCTPEAYATLALERGFIYEEAETLCDTQDNDCDGFVDDRDPDWPIYLCANQNGVCEGSVKNCADGILEDCTTFTYAIHTFASDVHYDPNPESDCDGADNDCNGFIDEEDPNWTPRSCFNQDGVCEGSVDRCIAGQYQGCNDLVLEDHSPLYSSGPELLCDEVDNNCSGESDELCCTTPGEAYREFAPNFTGELRAIDITRDETSGHYGFILRADTTIYVGRLNEDGEYLDSVQVDTDPSSSFESNAVTITSLNGQFIAFYGFNVVEDHFTQTRMVSFTTSNALNPTNRTLSLNRHAIDLYGGLRATALEDTNEIALSTFNFESSGPNNEILAFSVLNPQTGAVLREFDIALNIPGLAFAIQINTEVLNGRVLLQFLALGIINLDDPEPTYRAGNMAISIDPNTGVYPGQLYTFNIPDSEDVAIGYEVVQTGEYNRGFTVAYRDDGLQYLRMFVTDSNGTSVGNPIDLDPITFQGANITEPAFLYGSHVTEDGLVHLAFAFGTFANGSGQAILYSFRFADDGVPGEITESIITNGSVSGLLAELLPHPYGFLSLQGFATDSTKSLSTAVFTNNADPLCLDD